MEQFRQIQPQELNKNPFHMIGKEWMLVTAERGGKANTMTASWGGVGVMWGKDVAYVVIRPQRYTKEFIDASEAFSLSILGEGYRRELNYLGSVSGRNEDKVAESGLTLAHEDGVPYFAEASCVLLCKKLYAQPMNAESFIDKSLIDKWFAAGDFHTLYIAEITKVLAK